MSDRLALAHAFEESGMARDAAERVASTVYDTIRGEVARKSDLLELEQRVTARIAAVDQRLTGVTADVRVLKWQVGAVIAAQAVIGGPALWLLLRVAAKVGALG